jgi:hypothetical protein
MGGPARPVPAALLRRAADVTTEWLTAALDGAGVLTPGSRVVSFETEAIGTGQMADTTRFALRYDEDGSGPASVVGKFASADDLSRATGLALRAYEIEVRFYREVASRVTARVPLAYVAEVEPETAGSRSCSRTSWVVARATRSKPAPPTSPSPSSRRWRDCTRRAGRRRTWAHWSGCTARHPSPTP